MTLDAYRVDHLVLLVGGNPLPNYVAARLLAKRGATLHLIYTQRSLEVAQRLVKALAVTPEADSLGSNFTTPKLIQVDEANPHNIFTKTTELVEQVKSLDRTKSIGLHYTSGNRPMSVHAYDAIEEACDDAVFSYLDAGRLSLIIHDRHRSTRTVRADVHLNMRLETLFQLHGWKEKSGSKSSSTPLQPGLAAALADLHSTDTGAKTWDNWKKSDECANWTKLPQGEPGLEKVESALRDMCGGQEPTPELVAQALRMKQLPSCTKWFKSDWLECHVLAELTSAIEGRTDTHDALMSVSRIREGMGGDELELDVVVMRAYQLFAVSCIVSNQNDACKFHAMEAYVRARQTGGDEARVALVCIHSQPLAFQQKLASELDAGGKIRVFGQKDLMSLKDKFSKWLNEQP